MTVNAMTSNVTVTERAARQIGEILRQEPAGTMLRVASKAVAAPAFSIKSTPNASVPTTMS